MIQHDKEKNIFCINNNILLYRIPYWDFDKLKTVKDIINSRYCINNRGD